MRNSALREFVISSVSKYMLSIRCARSPESRRRFEMTEKQVHVVVLGGGSVD